MKKCMLKISGISRALFLHHGDVRQYLYICGEVRNYQYHNKNFAIIQGVPKNCIPLVFALFIISYACKVKNDVIIKQYIQWRFKKWAHFYF